MFVWENGKPVVQVSFGNASTGTDDISFIPDREMWGIESALSEPGAQLVLRHPMGIYPIRVRGMARIENVVIFDQYKRMRTMCREMVYVIEHEPGPDGWGVFIRLPMEITKSFRDLDGEAVNYDARTGNWSWRYGLPIAREQVAELLMRSLDELEEAEDRFDEEFERDQAEIEAERIIEESRRRDTRQEVMEGIRRFGGR